MSRLEIDLERCTGHGRCYALAPKLFDADDYGHAVLVPTDDIDRKGPRWLPFKVVLKVPSISSHSPRNSGGMTRR